MGRQSVSMSQIRNMVDGNSDRRTVSFVDREGNYKITKLNSNLAVPSYTHGYSLAIEYMRHWVLSKFPENFFNTVHINGKHVLDDWKYFNKTNIIRVPPLLAIMPSVDYDYDREGLDSYLADKEIYLRRSNYQNSFFRDYDNNLFIGVDFQALRMNFAFKIRVRTRAQQLDLLKNMQMDFRIGATQSNYVSIDYLIPKEILIDIAKKTGFAVDEENMIVKDVMPFLSYLNSHSTYPILFKMRAINQKPEFFLRMRNVHAHISCLDKLSPDDGERDGHLDTNFHIEFQAILTIPVPMFYIYFSADRLVYDISMTKEKGYGMYSFCEWELPAIDDKGWHQIAMTSYMCDKGEKFIDMSQTFSNNQNLDVVMKHSISNYISPDGYVNVMVVRGTDVARLVRSKMDYTTMRLNLLDDVDEEAVTIVIYADLEYINDTLTTLRNYNSNRIDSEKEVIPGTHQTTNKK